MSGRAGPVVLVGCGRLGSAIVEGWLADPEFDPSDLIIITPSSKPAADAAKARGARINPPPTVLGGASVVVLAVKPAVWRVATAPLVSSLASSATVVSVLAGVRAADIAEATGRSVARVMPTTAVAQRRGVAAVWSQTARAHKAALALFRPLAETVELEAEGLLDAATAVAGSAPAFIYAFIHALAQAGAVRGLPLEAAATLARGALRSAAAQAEGGEPLGDLMARIASPGGTTRAGLDALNDGEALDRLVETAVDAAVSRARALASE